MGILLQTTTTILRCYDVHTSDTGEDVDMSIKARPITVAIVCSHAEMFWFGEEKPAHLCDIELHSVLVLGMHLGLRFDEMSKLKS